VLHGLCSLRDWERWKDNSDTRGAWVWGCVSRGSTRVTPEEGSQVLHWSDSTSMFNIDNSLLYGFDEVGRVKEANKGVVGEVVYPA